MYKVSNMPLDMTFKKKPLKNTFQKLNKLFLNEFITFFGQFVKKRKLCLFIKADNDKKRFSSKSKMF